MSMSEYAPGAPAQIWALADLPDGEKLTLMWWWSKADHDIQRTPMRCTVWAPAYESGGTKMSACESMLEDLRRHVHPTKSDRTIRDYIASLRDRGLADAQGRCVDLVPPVDAVPNEEAMAKRCQLRQKSAKPRQKSAGKNLQKIGKNPQTDCENPQDNCENLQSQLNPPDPPNSPQIPTVEISHDRTDTNHAPRAGETDLFGNPIEQPQDRKAEESARLTAWWDKLCARRIASFARWHPSASPDLLALTEERSRDLLARARARPGANTFDRQLAVLDKVLIAIEAHVDERQGGSVPFQGRTFNTMKCWEPKHFLRKDNFNRYAEWVPVPQQPAGTGPRVFASEYDRIMAQADLEVSDYVEAREGR
jgi:hypothetical protein